MAKQHHDDLELVTAHKIEPAHGGGGGGAGKWIAGAAVAALLAGGGYFFFQNSGSAPSQQAALSDAYDASPSASSSDALVAETASAPSERSSSSAPRRLAANEPTEEVVGITQASAAGESEEIIIPAARRPVWAQRPSARRLSAAYPERALEDGREGEAQVSCTIGDAGALSCVKVSETPARSGFGNAAVRVAQMYRHADLRADGSPAAGTPVNVRVLFRQGEDGRRTF